MCGRFTIATPARRLLTAFEAEPAEGLEDEIRPSWNLPPTRLVLGVSLQDGTRVMDRFSWGLVPSWAKDKSLAPKTFNARAETVATKPVFRAAFKARRCLVPADPGFYEWSKATHEPKTPYLFSRADGAPMAFAGLWEQWRPGPHEPWSRSLTIITTEAGGDVSPVHDRQPVLLEAKTWERWLDPGPFVRDELEALLRPSPPGTMRRHRVSPEVGKASNDHPGLIEEHVPENAPPDLSSV